MGYLESKREEIALKIANANQNFNNSTVEERLAFVQQAFYDVRDYCFRETGFPQLKTTAFGFAVGLNSAAAVCYGKLNAVSFGLLPAVMSSPAQIYQTMFHEMRHAYQHANPVVNAYSKFTTNYLSSSNPHSLEQWLSSWPEYDAERSSYGTMTDILRTGEQIVPGQEGERLGKIAEQTQAREVEVKEEYEKAKVDYKANFSLGYRLYNNRGVYSILRATGATKVMKLFPNNPLTKSIQQQQQTIPQTSSSIIIPLDRMFGRPINFNFKEMREIIRDNPNFLTTQGRGYSSYTQENAERDFQALAKHLDPKIEDKNYSNFLRDYFGSAWKIGFKHGCRGRNARANAKALKEFYKEQNGPQQIQYGFGTQVAFAAASPIQGDAHVSVKDATQNIEEDKENVVENPDQNATQNGEQVENPTEVSGENPEGQEGELEDGVNTQENGADQTQVGETLTDTSLVSATTEVQLANTTIQTVDPTMQANPDATATATTETAAAVDIAPEM